MTERRTNPLSDALSAAEHSPEAQSYEVPVELIRSRSRRRRRARTGTAAGALALVVAGAALVVPNLPSRTPAPASDELAGAALCGQSTSDLSSGSGMTRPLPNGGDVPAGLRIEEGSVVAPADGGPWSLTTVTGETFPMLDTEVSAEPVTGPPVGWVYGTSVALLRDGVVVAASEGPGAPSIDDAVAMAADFGTTAFPLRTEDEFALVACTGDAVEAGDYELVAVQTYGWTYQSGGTWAARQSTSPVRVHVEGPAPVEPPSSLSAVCGLSTEDLAADDGGDTGSTVDVRIDATSTPADGPWAVATHIGLSPLPEALASGSLSWTYGTTVALVQDGRVVGALEEHMTATREEAARTAVDVEPVALPIVEDLAGRMITCATGEAGVAPGEYQLVASATIGFVPKTDPDSEVSIARGTSDPVDVTVSAAPTSDPLVCGAPDDGLRPLAGTGPLVLRADSAPSAAPSCADTSFTLDVTNESDENVVASTGYPEVILTRDGVIVGGLEPQEDIGFDVDLEPSRLQSFDAASRLASCSGDGSTGEPLPPGEYEMWAVMSFIPTTGAGSDPAAGWQTAGGPWPLTITADDDNNSSTASQWSPSCGDPTALLADRAAATAAGDVTLEVTGWANPDSAVQHRWLSQLDAGLTLTNGRDEPVTVWHIGLSASQGGTVVGQGLVYAVADERLRVTIDPGETVSLPRPLEYGDLMGCERNGFPAGELDGWVIVETDAGTFVVGPHPLEATD
jgi:hypothetical protein